MQHSRAITKKSASNLALAFILLPKQKRDAMSVLYAFCREVDDIADNENVPVEKRRTQLAEWRADVKRACENQSPQFTVNKELQSVIKSFSLPFGLFDDLLRGCEMDLVRNGYEDFEALEKYCYYVASVVGLLSIEIFGYKNPAARDYAVYLGKALQLTNILRDVKNDAERGRIYLPQSELKKFGVSEDEIFQSRYSGRFFKLAEAAAARAKEFYRLARKALPAEDRNSMVAAELMGSVYWQLLQKLERQQFNVFDGPMIRVTRPQKLFLILRSWMCFTFGATPPNYGTP
jgi:15-cis-phytoene synthase